MNYPKFYDIEHFNDYENKYAILLKDKAIILKKDSINQKLLSKFLKYNKYSIFRNIQNDYYVIVCLGKILIPVFGHFCNKADKFLCKKVSKKYDDDKYMLISRKKLYCNIYKHPVLYNTLEVCKKNIDILINDSNIMKYEGTDVISKYENNNEYEKINPEEFL